MRNFFLKIKNGIEKIINNIKNNFVNIKNKIKNIFLNIKNKIRENKKINITNSESVVSKENINNLSNERQRIIKNTSIPVNNNLEIKTTGQEAIVTPIVISKSQNKNNNWYNSIINNIIPLERDTYSPIEENNVVDSQENEKRIVSISIKEQIGIVEFKTTSGEKYQKDIEDILNDKKNI